MLDDQEFLRDLEALLRDFTLNIVSAAWRPFPTYDAKVAEFAEKLRVLAYNCADGWSADHEGLC